MKPHIIGKGGSKVQELEKDTFTRIRVPKDNASETPLRDYDDEVMIEVVIEGDEYGVASAITKIMAIVTERVSLKAGQFFPNLFLHETD